MNSNDKGLLDFNTNNALSGFIAAEEHAIGTTTGIDSWCIQKHLKFSVAGHHLAEMVQLTSEDNPKLSQKLADLRKRVEQEADKPSPAGIRDLRNEFRNLVGHKSLKTKCGTVCSLDRLSGGVVNSEESSDEGSGESGGKALLIGGLVVGVTILFLAKRRV